MDIAIDNTPASEEKERVMEPTISVYRKGDDLYITLEGVLNGNSSQQIFQILRNMVMTSLKCSPPKSQVAFTFRTCGKVDLKKLKS